MGERIASDIIENLLKAVDDEEILARLRQHGVAESELHDLSVSIESTIQQSPSPSETSIPARQFGTTSSEQPRSAHPSTQTDGRLPPQTPIFADQQSFLSPEISSPEKTGRRSNRGQSNQEAQEEGRRAEKWLREQLEKLLDEAGWKVSPGPERDAENRETDILLRKNEEEVHIEAKHMKSDPRLYWSEREISKAKEYSGRYFMALLSPSGEKDGYSVGWLWDPINDLREYWGAGKVGGVWTWRQLPVDFHEIGQEPWQIPNPRAKQEASNFSFEIKLDGLKCSAIGVEAILTKLPI